MDNRLFDPVRSGPPLVPRQFQGLGPDGYWSSPASSRLTWHFPRVAIPLGGRSGSPEIHVWLFLDGQCKLIANEWGQQDCRGLPSPVYA